MIPLMAKKNTWKFVVAFIIIAQLGIIFILWNNQEYSFTQCFKTIKSDSDDDFHHSNAVNHQSESSKKRTDVVILLTQIRSGSSILGEIFNQRSDVLYLYEPLFPFDHEPCELLLQERLQVLRHISKCELSELPSLYSKAFNVTNRNDIDARCKIYNICFATSTTKLGKYLVRDSDICPNHVCPKPINATVLSKHCRQSLIRAMKVIYVCKLEWLVPLLQDPEVNVKVVHLVRDPRATVNSRLKTTTKKTIHQASLICNRLIPNIKYADDVIMKSPSLREKYIRIRHEDFALDPVGKTQKIYDFIGINMNPSMKTWLMMATSSKNADDLSKKDQFGTTRNSQAVLTAWRNSLSFEQAQVIQGICEEVLPKLGYKSFNSENELRNLSKPSFV